MITPAKIHKKALRHFYSWLEDIAEADAPYQALVIPGIGDSKDVNAERWDYLKELASNTKDKKGYGYRIVLEAPGARSAKQQSRIRAIVFDTENDLLQFTEQEESFRQFQESLALIRATTPHLHAWCAAHVKEVIQYHAVWPQLLAVVRFLQENPQPGIPLRLWPLEQVDTKFIEQHNPILCKLIDATLPPALIDAQYKTFARRYRVPEQEPFVACYWNDPEIMRYFRGYTALAFPAAQFAVQVLPVKRVFIVENRHSVLQLLQMDLPDAIVVFGGGYGVALLKQAAWLQQIPLFYWGDLDTHGLSILSLVRSVFPHTVSIMMDNKTLLAHEAQLGAGKPFRGAQPMHLTDSEAEAFQWLHLHTKRLEQEKVLDRWVGEAVAACYL